MVTEAFGETRYEGRIGLLHIDGNHDYRHVLDNTQVWAPFVRPGGWIIFDDYESDSGDGVGGWLMSSWPATPYVRAS